MFVPRWWDHREPRDGPADEPAWMAAAYSDRTLVTRLGPVHADHAHLGDRPEGRPTSSATLPSLVVRMYRHARLFDGAGILDVGTGSGYGCALLATRFGDGQVTSVDIDPYLTEAAAERLDTIGLHPRVETLDATGPLPGTYDRIVAMTAVRPVPGSWVAALRPGGRLVTVIAGTTAIVTAAKQPDGWVEGRVEWDRAGFMAARSGLDHPPVTDALFAAIEHADGDEVKPGRYPVVNVNEAWELRSVLEVAAPGIQHYYDETDDGARTAWIVHPDGSWARATAQGTGTPLVSQGNPRRLGSRHRRVRGRSAPPLMHPMRVFTESYAWRVWIWSRCAGFSRSPRSATSLARPRSSVSPSRGCLGRSSGSNVSCARRCSTVRAVRSG